MKKYDLFPKPSPPPHTHTLQERQFYCVTSGFTGLRMRKREKSQKLKQLKYRIQKNPDVS